MAYDFARSVSQRRAIRKCGFLYFARYGMGYRSRNRRGTYAFGDITQLVFDAVIRGEIRDPKDFQACFRGLWGQLEHPPASPESHIWHPFKPVDPPPQGKPAPDFTCLRCGTFPRWDRETRTWGAGDCGALQWSESKYARTSWKMLRDRGESMATTVYFEIVNRLGQGAPGAPHPALLNVKRQYDLAPGVPETIKPDYVGPCQRYVEGDGGNYTWSDERVRTVLDLKTSDRRYQPLRVEMDEQLTDYQLGTDRLDGGTLGPIVQIGLVVVVYSQIPDVQWIMAPARSREVVDHFLGTALTDDRRIRGEEFSRNTDACFQMGECDMVPLCYPSQRKRLAGELVQDERKAATQASASVADL